MSRSATRSVGRHTRKPSNTPQFGYEVEKAGEVSGFYTRKDGKTYVREDGQSQIRKNRKEWVIRKMDEDGEWVIYYSHTTPKTSPPNSGWKSLFDGKVDLDVTIERCLRKFDPDDVGKKNPAQVVKLNQIDAKPAETPQQKRMRERMERKKAKMAARKAAREGKGGKKGTGKKSFKDKSALKKKGGPSKAARDLLGLKTPEKKKVEQKPEPKPETKKAAPSVKAGIGGLFANLPDRYGKYESAFREFGVTDVETLRDVQQTHLEELGVTSGLEQTVIMRAIATLSAAGGTQGNSKSLELEPIDQNVMNSERADYNRLKLKKKQLESKIASLETKKAKLEKEVLVLQREKLQRK